MLFCLAYPYRIISPQEDVGLWVHCIVTAGYSFYNSKISKKTFPKTTSKKTGFCKTVEFDRSVWNSKLPRLKRTLENHNSELVGFSGTFQFSTKKDFFLFFCLTLFLLFKWVFLKDLKIWLCKEVEENS